MFIELTKAKYNLPILVSCLQIESVVVSADGFVCIQGNDFNFYVVETYEQVKFLIRQATSVASLVTN